MNRCFPSPPRSTLFPPARRDTVPNLEPSFGIVEPPPPACGRPALSVRKCLCTFFQHRFQRIVPVSLPALRPPSNRSRRLNITLPHGLVAPIGGSMTSTRPNSRTGLSPPQLHGHLCSWDKSDQL